MLDSPSQDTAEQQLSNMLKAVQKKKKKKKISPKHNSGTGISEQDHLLQRRIQQVAYWDNNPCPIFHIQ